MASLGGAPSRWLVVMAKAPMVGAVKTRLAAEIGVVAAARFYRVTARNVIARLAADPRWHTVLAVTPEASLHESFWPADVPRISQGQGDLGARMQGIMDRMPPGPVIIVGTDIPRIAPASIARAFRLLGGNDAVLGPAGDGGYWLAGLRRSPRVLTPFAGVRWSSRHALADTRANLEGARVALADTLQDVDDAKGYRRLQGAGARVVLAHA